MIFNDLYCLTVKEERKQDGSINFIAEWKLLEDNSLNNPNRPCARTSHSCTVYKNRYLVIIGGETQTVIPSQEQDKRKEEVKKGAQGKKKKTKPRKKTPKEEALSDN